MAEELKSGPWHRDLKEFMLSLFRAKDELSKGYWCVDGDVKYLTVRIDTRDLSYLVFADGRGPGSETPSNFRISPDSVRAAIEKWRTQFHSKAEVAATAQETLDRSVDERDAVTLLRKMLIAASKEELSPKMAQRTATAADWLSRYDAKHPTQIFR